MDPQNTLTYINAVMAKFEFIGFIDSSTDYHTDSKAAIFTA